MMSKYKILSLDGGGIRGVISAILLERLEKAISGFITSLDLVAGTSTGGILALGLAHGLSPTNLKSLYIERGKAIFSHSLWDTLLNVGKVLGAEYSSSNLAAELQQRFGETTTLQDLGKKVVITAFDLDNQHPEKRTWKPKIFHNLEGEGSDGQQLVYKVGLYTSAAPTYFPSADRFVDGGVYANNPSMVALAQTQDRRYYADPPNLQDIVLLSLGTGGTLEFIAGDNLNWGYGQWIWQRRILSMIMDGAIGVADYQCRQILANRYYRLNPIFPAGQSFPLDAVEPEEIQALIEVAEGVSLTEVTTWLETQWMS
jgi:patatin-like phospholipase/acyl hydrolase